MTEAGQYKDTVNLPQTTFEMRANAARREPEIQAFWEEEKIYQRLSQENAGETFVLHDGPPYANGSLHVGHALNKILKDIINRYQLLQGRKACYIPGWDCHGLPIELKVLQQMKPEERRELEPLQLRQRARDFALATVKEQSQGFQRFGVWGDWENPYLTLTPEYEAAQIGVFGQMFLKGYIYRGKKPVHWSPSSQTALAEAELEYPEGHVSPSIYVAFRMVRLSPALEERLQGYLENLSVAIWTTTPWTIPGNLAVSVNPDLQYAVVEATGAAEAGEAGGLGAGGMDGDSSAPFRYLVVAAELVDRLSQTLGLKLETRETVLGKQLEYCYYQHPLSDRQGPVLLGGDYITTESGTGLVHTAPGHGVEDYQTGQKYGLPLLSPVDASGRFTAEAGSFAGMKVLSDGNKAIALALKESGALLKEEPYKHKYPYDWRTKKPVIYRATEQWFASVEGFREEALREIARVRWVPAQGENRITPMVSDRSDWCISRQRSWGVPIPVFYDTETGEPLLNEETIAYVQNIVADRGSDAWWELPVWELLPPAYRSNGRTYRKGADTMDVWFDSGSSWAAVADRRDGLKYPVDVYLEGSDQHRGWFQSSLLTSVAVNGFAPYATVLTHGFTLDENGRKMSKSLGNVLDPLAIVEGGKNQKQEPAYGADVLRLWVSSVDYSADVRLGNNIIKQLADVYRKIRNTARFVLGNLHDFDPKLHAVPYEDLPELDRYMLHRMAEVFAEVTEAFESYQFFRFFQTVQNFCVVDLSNFYLDIAKDRLYISAPGSFRRRSCQTVLVAIAENLARAIAPVLCHMAEDIWQNLPYEKPCASVFQAGWARAEERWHAPELAEKWQRLRQLRAETNKVLEDARKEKVVGSSLDAQVLLYVSDARWREVLASMNPAIAPPTPIETPVAPKATPPKIEMQTAAGDFEKVAETEALETPAVTELESATELQAVTTDSDILPDTMPDADSEIGEEPPLSETLTKLATWIAVISVFGVTAKVLAGMLHSAHSLPLLPGALRLLGLWFAARFAAKNLVFAHQRQSLRQRLQNLKQRVLGIEGVASQFAPTPWPAIATPKEAAAISAEAIAEPVLIERESETVARASIFVPAPGEPAAGSIGALFSQGNRTPLSSQPVAGDPETISDLMPVPRSDSPVTNRVDELRYLLLVSQVKLLPSPEPLAQLSYTFRSEELSLGVAPADGTKCARCWNYSPLVGNDPEHPLLCERCVLALDGQF